MQSADVATLADLRRIHPAAYLEEFKALSDAGGGELGLRTPFGRGAFEIAALSAGLVIGAARAVVSGAATNAYALSRPPGHHCLPEFPNGFCLLANIAIAIEALRADGFEGRIAVVDWDVHHGNGTEAIFYERADVLTISLHQERCYPQDTGSVDARGAGAGLGANINIPLPPGAGHTAYLDAMERIVVPGLEQYAPGLVFVACGFDASGFDPLSRMMCSAETFRLMTRQIMAVTEGRFVAAHEGGYSEMYVPFCGHAMLEEMSGSGIRAPDPMVDRINGQQPGARLEAFHAEVIGEIAGELAQTPLPGV